MQAVSEDVSLFNFYLNTNKWDAIQDEIKKFIVFNLHHIHTAVVTFPDQECIELRYAKLRPEYTYFKNILKTNLITNWKLGVWLKYMQGIRACRGVPGTCRREVK